MKNCIIVDIDGTLALMGKEKGSRGPFDWKRVGEDEPNIPIVHMVNFYKREYPQLHVFIVSGRDSCCEWQTGLWLKAQNILYDTLLMRKKNDNSKDSVVKQGFYERFIEDEYNVLFVLDDRLQTVEMWRRLGLTCLQVADGNF